MKDLLSRIGQWTEKMWRSIPIHLRDAIFTALLLGIAAVSYTHLDVYKRQMVRMLTRNLAKQSGNFH